MKFTINGNEYESAKYDYNTHCAFQEFGVNALDIRKKPESVLRAYLAISSGMSAEEAGEEIEKHIINGGDLTDLVVALTKEMGKSDFFQAILKKNQTEDKPKRGKKSESTEV
jgi:hypothetical protein